ncbi:MAG: hypothetical protein M0Z48_00620 [Nitrospiraceae bacterium]|nr:hypothetical protein [Nitrospiraceae bacterium]
MKVLAAKGTKCPMERQPRKYILDTPPDGETGFEVPEAVYYLRLLRDGSLVPAPADTAKKGGNK